MCRVLWTTPTGRPAAAAACPGAHSARRPPQLVGRVFRGSSVVATGLLTPKQLRSSAWRRLRQDVYADAALPVTHRLLISAVGLGLPEGRASPAAPRPSLWGVVTSLTPTDPVEVWCPRALDGIPVRASASVRLRAACNWSAGGRWLCTDRVDTAVDISGGAGPTRPSSCWTVRAWPAWCGWTTCGPRFSTCRGVRAVRRPAGWPSWPTAGGVASGDPAAAAPPAGGIALTRRPVPGVRRAGLDRAGRFRVSGPEDRDRVRRALARRAAGVPQRPWTAEPARRRGMGRLHVTAAEMRHPERLAARVRAMRAQRLGMVNTR